MKDSRISLHRSASLLVLSGWIFAFLVGFAPAAESIPINYPGPEDGLEFRTPVQVWDEALPLGNGTLGALLWGDGSPLKISLDRADLWDLRKVPEFYSEEYDFATMKRWHLEGNFAAAAGIQEMLLQSQGREVLLFPAVPPSWRDVAFTTLRARGAFLISARRKDGRLGALEVFSEKGGSLTLHDIPSGRRLTLDLEPGEKRQIDPAALQRSSR